ncbi:hypothetical protein CLV84_2711 [Neolewinella xylanilytica]|uniref:Uncharacterized protein n=1 Tax=Neolewinella xylanilytica TaxID=1514080 RepID=A0A2S6I3P5_9BACT|nr:hypothetical protein CLV84_2711 [Neolewinella xylanilytica]
MEGRVFGIGLHMLQVGQQEEFKAISIECLSLADTNGVLPVHIDNSNNYNFKIAIL